jgi:hypothetical protein
MMQPDDDIPLALRFGRVCRAVFPESPWEDCEPLVRLHWEKVRGRGDWNNARQLIREGWDLGPLAAVGAAG